MKIDRDNVYSYLISLDVHPKLVPEFSIENTVCYYSKVTGKIYKHLEDTLSIYSFAEYKKISELSEDSVRLVLSKFWGGIQYSRSSYVNNQDKIENFDNWSALWMDSLEFEFNIFDIELFTLQLNKFDAQLNKKSISEIVEYELLVLALFYEYSKYHYGSSFRTLNSKNQFSESFYCLEISTKNGQWINLSDYLFKALYPDYERDDFEDPSDVTISLSGLKGFIDYKNGDNEFKITE